MKAGLKMTRKKMKITDDLLPFLKEGKKYHRQLFSGPVNKRVEKDVFTVEDFWGFYVISCIGTRASMGRISIDDTPEQRRKLIQNIVAEERPISESELERLEKFVTKYGLQVALFCIDDIGEHETEQELRRIPPLYETLVDYLAQAVVYLAKLQQEDEIAEGTPYNV